MKILKIVAPIIIIIIIIIFIRFLNNVRQRSIVKSIERAIEDGENYNKRKIVKIIVEHLYIIKHTECSYELKVTRYMDIRLELEDLLAKSTSDSLGKEDLEKLLMLITNKTSYK